MLKHGLGETLPLKGSLDPPMRPAELCRQLLNALDATEGRRKRRKRDTTPDAIGLEIRRALLEDAAREDPAPEAFETWLMRRCEQAAASGPWRAMATVLLEEWRLAIVSPAFRQWLEQGAPSDDRGATP